MKYSVAILAAATTGALAQNTWGTWAPNGTVAYTTTIVTALTTYCPEAMEVTHGGNTYTVTEATTLTITDCPCTLTQPILTPSTLFYTSCPPGASSTQVPVAPPASMSASPNMGPAWSNPLVVSSATPTPIVKPNGGFATGTGVSPSKTPMFIITGAANANGVAGLLVGAVAGVVALAL